MSVCYSRIKYGTKGFVRNDRRIILYICCEQLLYFTRRSYYTLLEEATILYSKKLLYFAPNCYAKYLRLRPTEVPPAEAYGNTYGCGLRKYLRLRPTEVPPATAYGLKSLLMT
jgi:hypothetical protein